MADYYAILGLKRSCTQNDIRRKYRQLAMRYHPDHNAGDPTAEARFKEIAEAYNVLGDKVKRKEFDQQHPAESFFKTSAKKGNFQQQTTSSAKESTSTNRATQPPPHPPFVEILLKAIKQHPIRNTDRYIAEYRELIAHFFDLLHNRLIKKSQQVKEVLHRRFSWLPKMHSERIIRLKSSNVEGTGNFFRNFFKKKRRGRRRQQREKLDVLYPTPLTRAELKKGKTISVRIFDSSGKGEKGDFEFLDVTIPPGTRDGQKLRIRGRGHISRSGTMRGDLYLQIKEME